MMRAMICTAALGVTLVLAGCGIDGAPVPPPPKDDTERSAGDGRGTEVTVGVSGSIGGVYRR